MEFDRFKALIMFVLFLLFKQEPVPVPPPVKTKEDVLLFFKLYSPQNNELRSVLSPTIALIR